MKKLFLSLCVIILVNTVSAQFYQWAFELPIALRGRYITDMDVNSQGKMVIAGVYRGCIICSNGTVTKFNSDGTTAFEFAFTSGPNGTNASANSIAIDYNGNVYVTGWVEGTSASIGSFTVTSNFFMFKLDTAMAVKWVIENESGSLDADSAGNVYITNGIYTRKYNKSGIVQWTTTALQNANIAVDASKRVYLANTDSTMKISSNGLTVLYAVPRGGTNFAVGRTGNVFLVTTDSVTKLNTNGTVAWTNNTIGGNNIAVDKSNNAYIINNTEIKKLNFNGTSVLWTRLSDNAPFNHVGTDNNKHVYLCGNYDALNMAVLCPFKLYEADPGAPFSTDQCFAAKINISTPAPFQASIFTGSFDGSPLYPYLCNLTPYSIPFTYCLNNSSTFGPNNEFKAQISNDNFINYTDIGLASGAIIPVTVAEGTNYRIRVVSTIPGATTMFANTSFLLNNYVEVQDKSLSISATGSTTICSGDSVKLTATFHSSGNYYWIRNNGSPVQGTIEYYAKQSGTYKCMFQRLQCDTISNSIVITVNPKPAATITPQGPTTFCAGGSVVLSANTGAGLNYKWKKNGAYITGANLSNYTATTAGTYRVEVTNSNGCSKTSAATIVTVNCREGEHIDETAIEMQVFPNPIEDELNIHLKENHTAAIVKVINVTGEVIMQNQIPDGSHELLLDTYKWARGVYFVKVMSNEGEEIIKVVK